MATSPDMLSPCADRTDHRFGGMRAGAVRLGAIVPWRWIGVWLLLPNIVNIAMWPIGGPVMQHPLMLFGLAALLAAQLPWTFAKRLVLAVLMLAITTVYACLSFNLPIWGFVHLPDFAREVKPWRAPIYLAGAGVFLVAFVAALRLVPTVPRMRNFWTMLTALAAVWGVSQADALISAPTGDSYRASPGPGDPFEAASWHNGLAVPPTDGRNVVIVLVEALGLPTGDVETALFDAAWNRPDLAGRYDIATGSVPFYGSTTNAELRELCGQFGRYDSFDFEDARCLPEIYQAAGYRTSAMHSFSSALFHRYEWYPRLGFGSIEFAPELEAAGSGACSGLFPGACDTGVPAIIARRLKAGDGPQLIYWLTLNSHLPVVAPEGAGPNSCRLGPDAWSRDNQSLCRLFAIHSRLADALDALASDPDLPPTDFLIVGDHMPPFFQRETRLRFDTRHVPFIHLRSRAEAATPVGG
ncbi:sulfatase-like hydrolase/transferase [Aurantiacibacter spongiae]|uniref:Sulfatase N-terminal domain-containing protein n=1 Tax=Aurantiacibacter spongiae TaxID=2488860 RepID=A0A3N5D067_9SPHN|nr:sulfatase-like hydrolase/transferase [Aurantiacibacter spongiae]RPF72379.1 hypothetical protein EG799_12640 [Aurantiacibacter spongiae]